MTAFKVLHEMKVAVAEVVYTQEIDSSRFGNLGEYHGRLMELCPKNF